MSTKRGGRGNKLAILDIETDPFETGRFPRPFAIGFYCDAFYQDFWGPDCIDQMMRFLVALPDKYTIYAHNGGKFDFAYMVEYLDNPVTVIKGRLGGAKLFHHQVRDSFLILPIPLAAYKKTPIDYSKFEAAVRENHKAEILSYLYDDCRDLFDLVSAFIERFGKKLTIAKTAMTQLRKRHPFTTMPDKDDRYFRQFYFGGRVQCFRGGIINGPLSLYDLNSQYPHVMRNCRHPINNTWSIKTSLPDDFEKPFFVRFVGTNRSALPSPVPEGLTFDKEHGEFFACSHELAVALEFGLVDIERVIECYVATETISFVEFVDEFYAQKVECKRVGDKIGELFAKLILNSAYGKFGQNPRNYEDYTLSFDPSEAKELTDAGYRMIEETEKFALWGRPTILKESAFFDVSIAASITSAARSVLLRGLQAATDPIYCDTDSILCRALDAEIDSYKLGAWKHEGTFGGAVVAGKKLYGLFDTTDKPWKSERDDLTGIERRTKNPRLRKGEYADFKKLVSKGGRLTGDDLFKIARGGSVLYTNPVPTFSMKSKPRFVKRTFRSTVARRA